MCLSNIAISDIKVSDYCCIFILISKAEAINLMQNADLTEKSKKLSNETPRAILKLQIKMKKEKNYQSKKFKHFSKQL